jgi:(p)ppGpp synthase/HD superfamily hydrolase
MLGLPPRTQAVTDSALTGLPLTSDALAFARDRHAGQQRDSGGEPFVRHPEEVATLLRDAGYPDHVVAAGMLHEVLEDTDADKAELEERFGAEVAELVVSLSDDPAIDDEQERRAALRLQVAEAGPAAAAVFAADKVSKARELGLKAEHGELGEAERAKREHYEQSLEMLDATMPGNELVEQLRRELDRLPPA